MNQRAYRYNPFEIAVCGYANSGKTTLASKLVEALSRKHHVGYVKHAPHGFEKDHTGKDSWHAAESGAAVVRIDGPEGSSTFRKHERPTDEDLLMQDFVVVEGYKDEDLPKIIVIDEALDIIEDIKRGRFERIVAAVGATDSCPELDGLIPYFHRDDIERVLKAVQQQFHRQVERQPLYGLILAGGRSKRMKQDKASLVYEGKEQSRRAYDLLTSLCHRVFISNRSDQQDAPGHHGMEQIHDRFQRIGPMAGVLSAQQEYPNTAWMVLACDMPFLHRQTLQTLLQQRDPYRAATIFTHKDRTPEPLCTIYEPKSHIFLMQQLAHGRSSLRDALRMMHTRPIATESEWDLRSVDTEADYQEIAQNQAS